MSKNRKSKFHGYKRTPALFEYRQGDSLVHRIPALIKIFLTCFISIRVFSVGLVSLYVQAEAHGIWLHLLFYSFFAFIVFILARTPIKHLKKILFVPITGIMITLFKMIEFNSIGNYTDSAHDSGFFSNSLIIGSLQISLNSDGFSDGIIYMVRFFITAVTALVLFETTSRLEIFEAFEQIESFIKKIFPFLHKMNFAKVAAITISFIPEIFIVWNQVNIASQARTPKKNIANSSNCSMNYKSNANCNGNTKSKNRRKSNGISLLRYISIAGIKFSVLLSCMLQRAEETRKAVENRSRY